MYLRRIAALGSEEAYARGSLIFKEGAAGDKLYLILAGSVRISRQVPAWGKRRWPFSRPATTSARWR